MKETLDVLFESEIRTNLLVFLNEGPHNLESIYMHLRIDEKALLPYIEVLEEHYLIKSHSDTYELTTIGKLIIDKMISFLNTLEKVGSMEGHTSG